MPRAGTTALITSIKKSLTEFKPIDSSTVYLSELSRHGVQVCIEYFTTGLTIDESNQLKEKVNLSVKQLMDEGNITLTSVNSTLIIKEAGDSSNAEED